MKRWSAVPEDIRAVGESLLKRENQGEVALLGTINGRGDPALSPVCPIFADDAIFVLISKDTPKHQHLLANPRYALHAQVGADDLEFQISGDCRFIEDTGERGAVIDAIPFPDFDPSDPIVELLIEHALTVTWMDGRNKNTWKSE